MTPTLQLLAYRFAADAAFEGRLVGALERMESGGTLRIRSVLFVGRDADANELVAVAADGRQPGSVVAPLLGFRLDAAERAQATRRALQAYDRAPAPNPLRVLGEALAPGRAVAAVLVEHVWARAVDDAVARTGGAELASGFVDEADLAELVAAALAAHGEHRPA